MPTVDQIQNDPDWVDNYDIHVRAEHIFRNPANNKRVYIEGIASSNPQGPLQIVVSPPKEEVLPFMKEVLKLAQKYGYTVPSTS